MGHRAWFAIDRSEHLVHTDRDGWEAEYGESTCTHLTWDIVSEARSRGWTELWQLGYCQWCATYAHDADPSATSIPWDMEEAASDSLRDVFGPTARSIFASVESDEAAWVIPPWPQPQMCLWELRLRGYWEWESGGQTSVWRRMPYLFAFSGDRPDLFRVKDRDSGRIVEDWNDFWNRDMALGRYLIRMSDMVIQWGFSTEGDFGRWTEICRQGDYRDDDDPLHGIPAWWEPIRDSNPLKDWWFDFLTRMEWRPDDRETFERAWADTVRAYQVAAEEAGAPPVAFCSPIPAMPAPSLSVVGTINRFAMVDLAIRELVTGTGALAEDPGVIP